MRLIFLLALMDSSAGAICGKPTACFVVELRVQKCEAVTAASPRVTEFFDKRKGGRFKDYIDPEQFRGLIVSVSELRKIAVPCGGNEEPGLEQFAPYDVAVSTALSSYEGSGTTCKEFKRGKILRGTQGHGCCDTGPSTLACAFDLPFASPLPERLKDVFSTPRKPAADKTETKKH